MVLILMYERARRHVPETRVLVTGYIKGFTVGAAIWLVSAFVPEPFRFYLWAIALAVEFATPYIMRREQAKVPLDVSHLPERFGLFTILVLGESIAAVVAGLSGRGWELAPAVAAALGVVVATGMWWLYFDNLEGSVVRRRADQAKAWRPTVWIFSHLPLAAGVAIAGVGLEHAVFEAGGGHAHTASRWLLVGAVALAFAAMAAILIATVPRRGGRAHIALARSRLSAIPVILAIGLLSSASSVLIVSLIAAVCCVEVAADVLIQTRADSAPAEA
jgi:low temperature requirement protein LtrA